MCIVVITSQPKGQIMTYKILSPTLRILKTAAFLSIFIGMYFAGQGGI